VLRQRPVSHAFTYIVSNGYTERAWGLGISVINVWSKHISFDIQWKWNVPRPAMPNFTTSSVIDPISYPAKVEHVLLTPVYGAPKYLYFVMQLGKTHLFLIRISHRWSVYRLSNLCTLAIEKKYDVS